MKPTVVVFPGSNCERDAKVALERLSGGGVQLAWHGDAALPPSSLIVIPGGFSYGDYLRCGAIATHSPIMRDVKAAADRGIPIVGICNGFQVLCEAGLLPGVLMRNASLKFVCRDVHLKVEQTKTPFTSRYTQGQIIRVPVAHHDGNYFADNDTLRALEDDHRVVFRYTDANGVASPEANPNGSRNNIAGVTNAARNVVGLMPHPERLFEEALGGTDGRALFESALEAAAA
ncbi:MAG: phosphoribosylformylglycinamidine synthase subunit PurQ [Pseudomonadota bacterium]